MVEGANRDGRCQVGREVARRELDGVVDRTPAQCHGGAVRGEQVEGVDLVETLLVDEDHHTDDRRRWEPRWPSRGGATEPGVARNGEDPDDDDAGAERYRPPAPPRWHYSVAAPVLPGATRSTPSAQPGQASGPGSYVGRSRIHRALSG